MTTHAEWLLALERLERDVDLAEQLAHHPASAAAGDEAWERPQLEGSVPADLAERAVAIRARQVAAESALATALGAARRQHRFTDRVDRATARPEQSVYVDLEA